jgi:hypothetical protein
VKDGYIDALSVVFSAAINHIVARVFPINNVAAKSYSLRQQQI